MLTYPHVEDYLEYLAGYEVGITALIIPQRSHGISLARYDVQIVNSMAANTAYGTALTDRQAELVVKLILKYRKQFAKQGIDVAPVEEPQFRIPPRKLDRSKSIWIEEQQIRIKFPYDQKMIDQVREFKETCQGSARWNNQTKMWTFGLTEYNLNWLMAWGKVNQFDMDQQIQDLFEKILACERSPYEIKLVKDGSGYKVTNAADSLQEYIDQHVGNDLVKLVDHAGVLGYAVDADILEECSQRYGTALEYIGIRHSTHLMPISEPSMWDWVLDYAELTDRYPICIYDPSLVDMDISRFKEEEIVRFDHNGKTKTSDYDPYGVKVVYARRIPKTWEFPVPLLVTTAEMMYGGMRMEWINRAEKIVYWTNTMITEKN